MDSDTLNTSPTSTSDGSIMPRRASFELPSSTTHTIVLGEIVGATNLVAALRETQREGEVVVVGGGETAEAANANVVDDDEVSVLSSATTTITFNNQPTTKNNNGHRRVNSFCCIYWGDHLIHQTKIISKNNNPIWACDTGSLFKINVSNKHDFNIDDSKNLRIEVYDRVNRKKNSLIGVVNIPARQLGSLCDERRNQFVVHNDHESALKASTRDNNNAAYRGLQGLRWDSMMESIHEWINDDDSDDDGDDEIDSDDSVYGNDTVITFRPEDIDDDFMFGKNGTLALRFRIATKDDLDFLKAMSLYHKGMKFAKKKRKQAFESMRTLLDGRWAFENFLVSDKTMLDCDAVNSYWMKGVLIDPTSGVRRLRVKPGPDPSRPDIETKFLSADEMVEECNKPSKDWVEAGSGNLGQIKVEILSCQGLSNKDLGKLFGRKSDAFVCVIYEDCLVQTDIIMDCLNPMWMPWTQRAFVFNRTTPLSSVYIGVFNHEHGPFKHNGLGRIAIDLNKFEPNTMYTLKYNLYNSPVVSTRKSKGTITIRLQITDYCQKHTLLSIPKPPLVLINIKHRKTLSIARYTCYGKYREEVYNTKILRSYVDEIMEYIEMLSFEVSNGIQSLIFWRAQVYIGKLGLPLHSMLAFATASYVVERPHLLPSYIFFCLAWCMLLLMNQRRSHPCPWYQSMSFLDYVKILLPLHTIMEPKGVTIGVGEGFEEKDKMLADRKKKMEDDKLLQQKIARVRKELNEILITVGDVSLQTNDSGAIGSFNPLSKLLPVQLILKDILFYVRWVKAIVSCEDSRISFFLTAIFITIGSLLLVLPVVSIIHWACRVLIWVFLGPWMKAVDIVLRRKNTSKKVNRTVQRVVKEIQEREEKRFLEARIQREEALKLKATRALRFGRFAVRVPAANITRHHDYPLPDSFSRPIDDNDKRANARTRVKQYIPGQSTHGVMIPELVKPEKKRLKEKLDRKTQLAKLKQSFTSVKKLKRRHLLRKGIAYLSPFKSKTNTGNIVLDNEEKELAKALRRFDTYEESSTEDTVPRENVHFEVEARESFTINRHQQQIVEEGFELVVEEKIKGGLGRDDNLATSSVTIRTQENRDDSSYFNRNDDDDDDEMPNGYRDNDFRDFISTPTNEENETLHFLASPSQVQVDKFVETTFSDLSER